MTKRQALLAAAILFFAWGVWRTMMSPPPPVIPKVSEAEVDTPPPALQVASNAGERVPPPRPNGGDEEPVLPRLDLDQAEARFAKALLDAGTCLGIDVVPMGENAAPRLDEWLGGVRRDLGDPLIDTEDWSVTTLLTPSGQRRFLRFEIDYSNPENVVRRVSYYEDRGDGTATTIPLNPEQATEPSDSFRATLEQDGEVVERERSRRLYFDSGAEIVVTEKNELIEEIEMNRFGKSFSCRPFDPSPYSCQCR